VETEIVKVSSRTPPKLAAGAIAALIRDGKKAEVQAIGAGAANQAIKAIAIARGFMKLEDVEIICVPAFTEVEIEGVEKTAIQLIVEVR